MRFPLLAIAALLALSPLCSTQAAAQTRVNLLLGSEMARGLGASLEFGETDTLLLGTGAEVGLGYSSVEGWIGWLSPGIGAGYRHYFGNWFLGPTAGIQYHRPFQVTYYRWSHSNIYVVGDFGYRWLWDHKPGWNTRLGFGLGADIWPGYWTASPTAALTASIGFDL